MTWLTYSACHNYTRGGPNSLSFFWHKIEQFWHMEMVDMVIVKHFVFLSKIEKCQFFSSSWIWDLDGIPPPGSTVQTRRIHPPGQISQFHPPGLLMTCRVCTPGSSFVHQVHLKLDQIGVQSSRFEYPIFSIRGVPYIDLEALKQYQYSTIQMHCEPSTLGQII